jgi:hypothetical protein
MQQPLKHSGVLVRRGRWGSHGSEQPGPNLLGVNTRAKEVADGFALLITERTDVVLLEAMPQPPFRRPQVVMQREPKEYIRVFMYM